ncbi:ribokinase [Streptomyces adustus]|uniref:Ribokinase n=1 Tax=Streptomyces adustus TaxID=1609272 RepID=A0A5N8VAF4_9ACTN|nr:ribokinase [Streptomyces adustus]MPY32241.1 ribokinase [Streptomyces adustus]
MDTTASSHTTDTVCVVGSINADLSVVTEHLPQPGQTVRGGGLVVGSGGKSANQAVAASRLGASVSMVGAVGHDEHGGILRDALERDGIDITRVRSFSDVATGTALITIDREGENTIVVSPGANGVLGERDVELAQETIARAAVLGLAFEVDDRVVLTAARIAHSSGGRVVLNPSPYRTPHPDLLAMVDLLVVNELELADMVGADVTAKPWEDICRALFERFGIRSTVVTAGARGAVVLSHGDGTGPDAQAHVVPIAAITVDAVDTTGCGDAFLGAVLAGLADGRTVVDAAHKAAAVAAYAATRRGAQSSYPTDAEVQALLGSLDHDAAPAWAH